MMKKYHILIALLLVMYTASAQRFPVRIIPTVNPPAPVNFYNYADGTTLNSPLRVQLLLGDLAISNRQIRLKVAFEGNGIRFESTDNVIGAAPLFIDGGTPLLLTNADLAPYFELQNLQGISPRRYGQVIPEGNYQFCFEVFDVARGVQLGERTCASTFIFNNDPPFLNLPVDGANIEPKPVDNIVFQWTPRHINVSNVEYEFSLVEIWDNSVDPQTAFLTSPPIYQVTTRATSLVYGPAQPLLLNNKRYAWQVQAKALRGAEEIGLFRNDGKSEVFWFSKTETCGTPKNISGEPKGLSKMNVFWDEDPNVFSEYTIAYREKDRPNARWFTKRTNAGWATVWDLKPNTTYEYKVKGKCTFQYGAYSNTQELRTAAAEDETANYNCGIVPDEVAITNRQGHSNLLIGDRITAGDFVITLTDITSEANGVISGSGFVRVPYFEFARFGVVFNNILVNTDYQLAEGEIVTLYDPVFGENAELVVDINTNVGKGINGDKGEIKEVTLDFVIEKITINEFGAIVVTGTNGEEHIIPGGKDVTIVDKEGTPWTVSENGEITKGESAQGGKATPNNTQGISASGVTQITAKGVRVTFNNSGFYYYDGIPNRVADKLTAVYDYLPINEGGEYAVPYKVISNIPSHENDIITATVTFTDNSSTKEDIIFKTKDGIKVNATWEGNTATLQLQQKFDYAVEDILATVKPKDSTGQYTVAGVFKHVHLAAQELKAIDITLVPVQRNAISANIKAQINAIYNKAGADFNITIDPPLDISKADWNLDGNDTVDVGDSSLLAQYTEEERAIFRYYKSQRTYDSKRYYIFVLGETMLPSKTIEGFMPLGRQYGFVFNPSNLAKTIAHELGHGVFGLQHPWDTYNFEPGQTDWLMDNSPNGTALNHMDWEQMHSGGINIYAFQDDEDGEFEPWTHLQGLIVENFEGYENLNKVFIDETGALVKLPAEARDFSFYRGYLIGFTINNERWISFGVRKKDKYKGFYKDVVEKENGTYSLTSNNKPYIFNLPIEQNDDVFFVLKPKEEGSCVPSDIYKAVSSTSIQSNTSHIDQKIISSTDLINENGFISAIENFGTNDNKLNCLPSRTREFFKFVIEHNNSYNNALTEEEENALFNELVKYKNIHIQGLDGNIPSAPYASITFNEMLNYGVNELVANLKENENRILEELKDVLLVITMEDYELIRDVYDIYNTNAAIDKNCTFFEHTSQLFQDNPNPSSSEKYIAIAKDVYEVANLNEFFEGLSCLLGKAIIPEKYYNKNRLDFTGLNLENNFQQQLALVGFPSDVSNNLSDFITFYQDAGMACGCGAWNSAIDAIKGLPDLAAMLSTHPEDVYNAITGLFRDNNGDLASKGFLEGTIEALKAHHGFHNGNIVDEYEVAYSVCYDAVFVLSLYVGVGEVKALAQAGSFAKRIAILKGIVKNIPKSAIGSIKNIPKMLQKLPENTQKVLLTMANEALLHAPKTYLKALDTQIATLALYTNTSVEIARFTANGYVIISEASRAAQVKNIIFTSAEDVTNLAGDSGKLVLFTDEGGEVFAKIVDDLVNAGGDLLNSSGKFIDDILEADYAKYLTRKSSQGKPPRNRLDWKEARDYWLNDSPLARGNNFNKKAWKEEWYPAWEVRLDNGKFIDGYNPFTKEIVSRKATELVDIQESTFIKYLDELKTKYAPPRTITTKKQGAIYDQLRTNPELPLDSKLILEIPESNANFSGLAKYRKIAEEKGIILRLKPE